MTLLRIAARNLLRNRRRTALGVTAIAIGVAAMIGFQGFVHGQRAMMYGNLVDGVAGAVQIHKKGYVSNVLALPLTLDFADTPELRAKIAAVEGVKAVAPRINFGTVVDTPDVVPPGGDLDAVIPGKNAVVVATAIDPVLEREVTPRRFTWVGAGRIFDDARARAVVVNDDVAQSLGVDPLAPPPADEREWPGMRTADRDGALNGLPVRVVGTLVQATPGDKKNALVPLGMAQELLRMDGRITEYAVAIDDLDDAHAVKARLVEALGPGFEVHTWDELLPFIKDLVGFQDVFLRMIGIIILLTVLLGIANSMLMNVLERVREIGTMLAVGTRRKQITRLFLLEGALLGLLGGVAGAVLGGLLVLAMNRYGIHLRAPGADYTNVLRPYVPPLFLLQAALFASLGAALAALWPAWRASRLQPVDALRSV